MQKNMMVFTLLSVMTFVGWTWYMHKFHPTPLAHPVTQSEGAATTSPGSSVSPVNAVAASGGKKAVDKKSQASLKEQTVKIEMGNVEAVLSSVGARIISWKLLPYKEHKGSPEQVQLIPEKASRSDFGALEFSGGTDLSAEHWRLETPEPRVMADGSREIVFSTHVAGSPLLVRKTFTFDSAEFIARVRLDYVNEGRTDLKVGRSFMLWGPGLGQLDRSQQGGAAASGVVRLEKSIERERPSKEDKVFEYSAPFWVAQKNHYFVAAMIPEGSALAEAQTRRHRDNTLTMALGPGEMTLKAGETRTMKLRLYAGPQIYEKLETLDVHLEKVIQFMGWDWLRWLNPLLCVPMLRVMRWFYHITGNWGVAIILLTALVRAILFYPSQKSMVSMRKMQTKMAAMKPRLESLKLTYKDEPQKLNAEMMRLYKEYGVNPLGGCLPMLAQIPVFFALYGTLMAAFEIRGAPFFWKWDDLSGPDPTYIFALVMGASMFLQQKMAPTSSATMSDDQAQMQKMMMYMMPVMFTGMAIFLKWPMGLLLYWSVSNLFGVGQQWYVNKTVK